MKYPICCLVRPYAKCYNCDWIICHGCRDTAPYFHMLIDAIHRKQGPCKSIFAYVPGVVGDKHEL